MPGLYIGVVLVVGLLALVMALVGESRTGMAALWLLYTYSWCMSMLDSYQHHYLLSVVLFCLVFFPPADASGLYALSGIRSRRPAQRCSQPTATATWSLRAAAQRCSATLGIVVGGRGWRLATTSAWSYRMLLTFVGIVYGYTALAKVDDTWRKGHTFRSIGDAGRLLEPLSVHARELGMSSESFWELMASSVVLAEVLLALGYVVVAYSDQLERAWLRLWCLATWLLALGLHAMIELIDLSIGWFSYYMLWAASVALLPASWLHRLGMAATWPARLLQAGLTRWEQEQTARREGPLVTLVLACGAAALTVFAGRALDLPGAPQAALVVAVLLLVRAVVSARSAAGRARLQREALATVAAVGLLWLSVTNSDVRYDYYRFVGGDLSRRDRLEDALSAYLKAERYAPEGESRKDKIARLKRQLGI